MHTTLTLNDGRVLACDRELVHQPTNDPWETTTPGPARYNLDGNEITRAEAIELI